ncbi:MAG: hypothetical protein RR426_04465 [Oscillospiraceae bacterium]
MSKPNIRVKAALQGTDGIRPLPVISPKNGIITRQRGGYDPPLCPFPDGISKIDHKSFCQAFFKKPRPPLFAQLFLEKARI